MVSSSTSIPEGNKKHHNGDDDIETHSAVIGQSTAVVDPAILKRLRWKTDLIILPLLTVAYLFKSVVLIFTQALIE